jgi:hypothetical protein
LSQRNDSAAWYDKDESHISGYFRQRLENS